ncbi:MAG: LURP-one-related/scramblase family protein [Streptococcus sp.]
MKTYFVKQKFRLGGERFDIKDDQGRVAYQVEGSFLRFQRPLRFLARMVVRSVISPRSLLVSYPNLRWIYRDGSSFYIRKKLSFLRDKYDVDNLGLRIEGNIWDLDFQLLNSQNQVVARIQKELFHLTSTYTVTVYENTYADLAISLCVAIDYVEMLENSSK